MDTFRTQKKQAFFYLFLSVLFHILFVFSLANLKIHIPFIKKPLVAKRKQTFESIQAVRQLSLNQTFQRFYPFFTKKHQLNFPANIQEEPCSLNDNQLQTPFSIGADQFTIINPHFNAPDLFAVSFPSDLNGIEQINLPRNVPIVMPLNLDDANLKKEIKEATTLLQQGLLNSFNDVNQMLSSKILLAKMNENLNPYQIDLQNVLPKPSALFEKLSIELPSITFSKNIESLETFLESEFDKLYTPTINKTSIPKDSCILSDAFVVEVKKVKQENGKYTFFSICLTPKAEFSFEKINQDFIFLIDRSNSISKDIFHSCKRSVSFSLDILPKNEHFNIAIFDTQLHCFSEQNELIEKSRILRAKTYLETRNHGGMFASTDLFAALKAFMQPQQRMSHIFLFSDGDTFLKQSKKIKDLIGCLSKNQKMAIHCIATGQNNNLSLLQLLSYLNRGEMIYEKNIEKLETTFLHALSVLTSTIATNTNASIHTLHPEHKIGFFTPMYLMKMLYSKKPYILYGVSTSEEPFEFFLQAEGKNDIITIKKSIDLKTAKTDPTILDQIKWQKAWIELEEKLYTNLNLPISEFLD